jgi:Inner membrane protein YgaP-like, transmembrane domain
MRPHISGWNRAARVVIGSALFPVGAALWPDAPDLCCLIGVTTFMSGLVGWCPLCEWLAIRGRL